MDFRRWRSREQDLEEELRGHLSMADGRSR